jgi:recombination protein RecR
MPGKSNPWNDRCMPIHPDNAIDELIAHLRRLPGVGRRSAERHAHAMLEWDEETLKALGDCISHLRERVAFCPVCGAIQDDAGCRLCNDPRRDQEIICVVEHFSQIPVIEKSGCYKGAYHVLGGRLQPLDGKGPDSLRGTELRRRLEHGRISEIILALSPDIEGEATAAWLCAELTPFKVKISRIASGIPAGADLSYADSATMALAITRRQNV